ncbi:ParB N-terminal domain-containing protein [Paracoccus sp. MC1862]|uniref:ParB/RepB/Spo0J family partition protein n=1 Tax=Paracoccus sp. MC1862 TaxID=2760307 RepID=UPI0016001C04|nr:ParB N-terminal domain-containing protein [Paracoccus sp. MC1862]MBB1499127.1 ParB N-terminal domain-containing protein [Paracoccus sp. MC1862]QQO46564.1 ParB N-terminal domain-containing protein [Paracoccus sp. MC1862]
MKRETIAPASIQFFSLAQLYLSDLNPRQDADPEGIDLLADSLAMIGLIQNLSGILDAEGRVGIVAGGRRLRAIARAIERDATVTERHPELASIPVRIAPDEATARAWASAENAAREDLAPADEIRAYGRMKEAGADVSAIARSFGKTEAHVYRRLALAALPAPVLDALKEGQISLGMAKAFTVSQDEALTLTILAEVKGRDVSEHRIKQALQPAAVSATDRRARFVGLDAYEAAGGSVSRDLFSETVTLHDADLLQDLFTERLNAEAERLTAVWKWAEVMADDYVSYSVTEKLARLYPVEGVLTEEQAERYDELAELANADALDEAGQAELDALDAIIKGDFTDAQRAAAGYHVYVSHSGTVQLSGPWVRAEDRAEAIEAGALTGHAAHATGGDAAPAPRSPYTGALVEDMKAIRLAAIQTALLDKPDMVFDLLAFGLSLASGVSTSVFDLSPGRPMNCPSKTDCLEWSDRLAHPPAGHEAWSRPELRVEDLAQAFRDFTAAGKKARNAALVEGVARALPYGAGNADFFALIEADSGASIRKVWTPTAENFFNRVSADTLDSLHLDLTGCDPEGRGFKAHTAQKKAEKARCMERLFSDAEYQKAWRLTAEAKARIDAWVPDCF